MSLFSRPITIPATLAPAARPVPGRWIDPRAQRFGAATSALTLLLAVLLNAWPLAAAVGVFTMLSAALGTRWFIFGRPWPLVRSALRPGAGRDLPGDRHRPARRRRRAMGLAAGGGGHRPPGAPGQHRVLPWLPALLPALVGARPVCAAGRPGDPPRGADVPGDPEAVLTPGAQQLMRQSCGLTTFKQAAPTRRRQRSDARQAHGGGVSHVAPSCSPRRCNALRFLTLIRSRPESAGFTRS